MRTTTALGPSAPPLASLGEKMELELLPRGFLSMVLGNLEGPEIREVSAHGQKEGWGSLERVHLGWRWGDEVTAAQ